MGFENKIGLDQDSNDGELTGINFVNFCTRSNQFEICENKLNLDQWSSKVRVCGWAY